MDSQDDSELLGAHDQSLPIKSSGARATVRLDTGVRRKVSESLAAASETVLPDHVYSGLKMSVVREAHINLASTSTNFWQDLLPFRTSEGQLKGWPTRWGGSQPRAGHDICH